MKKMMKKSEKLWGEIDERQGEIHRIVEQPCTFEESREALRVHLDKILAGFDQTLQMHLIGEHTERKFEGDHPDRGLIGCGYVGKNPTGAESGVFPNVLTSRPWNPRHHLTVFPVHTEMALGLILRYGQYIAKRAGAQVSPDDFFAEILSKAPKSAFGTMTLAEKDKKVYKLKAEIAERETELKGVLRQMLERMLFEEENVNIAIVERLEALLEGLIRGERRKDEDFAVLKRRFDAIAGLIREKKDEGPYRELRERMGLNDVDTEAETREERRERLLTIKKKAGG